MEFLSRCVLCWRMGKEWLGVFREMEPERMESFGGRRQEMA